MNDNISAHSLEKGLPERIMCHADLRESIRVQGTIVSHYRGAKSDGKFPREDAEIQGNYLSWYFGHCCVHAVVEHRATEGGMLRYRLVQNQAHIPCQSQDSDPVSPP